MPGSIPVLKPREVVALREGHGVLILGERTLAESLPWEPDLRLLIREYSTNRDYLQSGPHRDDPPSRAVPGEKRR